MASLVRPVAGFAAACLTVPLYQTMYATLGCYVAGERDLLASHFLIFGILTYRARSRGGPIGWLVLTAGALSLAVLTRPTYLAFAPLAAVAIMLTRAGEAKPGPRQSQDVYKIAAFFMGTMAIVALIGLWRGTLGAWYEVGIRFNMDVNSVKSTSYRDLVLMLGKYVIGWWHWYFALATIGGLAWWRCRKDRLTLYLLLSLALAAFISFFVQRKGATYHLAGMIPVLCPLIASLIGWCLTQFRVRATLAKRAAGTCVVIIVLVGCGLKIANAFRPQFAWLTGGISREMMLERMPTSVNGVTYADVVEASDLVKRTVPAGKTVLVWGRCVEINYLSKRRSPTRFITFGMLRVARDPFFLATKWAEEFERAFDEAPPEVIVLPGLGTNEDYAELWLDPSPSRSLLVLQSQIRNRYHKWKSIGALDLYQLTPGR